MMEQKAAICFVSLMGTLFLAINTLTIYSYYWPTVSFMHAISFIIVLFLYLQLFDRAEDRETRDRLKVVIWAITTSVGITSAARASMIHSFASTWWAWVMVGFISSYSFYSFFVKKDENEVGARSASDVDAENFQMQV